MENSIDEDIARIAKLITTKFNNDYSIDNKDKEAIEHILSDYERLKGENIRLESENAKLEGRNARLEEIRNDIKYGTESIHLIPENDLVQINFNKYMIEIEEGKFIDLKVVYQENKENKELIERMRAFLLKEKLMQKFLESEE